MIRTLARPMLAATFIAGGYSTMTQPERVAPKAEPLIETLAERVPGMPNDAETMVRLNGTVQVVAGVLFSLGFVPRISALALAGSLMPTTFAGHPFWEIEDPQERAQHRTHFLKNVGMLGGLLLAATEPRTRTSRR